MYSCLAHVINLATQALISAYSQSPHFDPKNPEAHIPTSRDEVGLVRAIAVKVRITGNSVQLYSGMNTVCYLGAVIIEAETNVEYCSDKGRYCKTGPTPSRYEGPMVIDVSNARQG